MKDSESGGASAGFRTFNAVALQSAVLCAECDCVSDSPHDKCLVCGSHSLFNISRVLGGNLSGNRAALVEASGREKSVPQFVLTFPSFRRMHRKQAGGRR